MNDTRNIYKTAREQSGYSQEAAAADLPVCVESLRAFESGRRVPSDDIVLLMTELYKDRALPYWHLRGKNTLGAKLLPDIRERTLAEATLRLMHVLGDIVRSNHVETLVEIAEDGKVDEREAPIYAQIMDELRQLVAAYYQLEYAK